ncbi:group II intron reverse transcriptase/maturase, partial [Gordonia sp. TBRC 11910]|nr:group II intron reverse transcriptase/maturase [Gordonia asplenii]
MPSSARSEGPVGVGEDVRGGQDVWGRVFDADNLLAAVKRVERNRGAAGVDGMTTGQLRAWCETHWVQTRVALDAGTYRPSPVRQVLIPKPDGRVRKLGVPTVVDRMIQQALAQVLIPVFDPGFVPVSYGFRPGKKAHDAVKVARLVIDQGYSWVVEVDLDAFFDRVNHDILMSRVARKVTDKRVLRLIRAYVEAGIMVDGVCQPVTEGTPQGSPLSPLLSNIMLDDFDQEFWDRGHRFVRYADDIRIFVKSQRAAQRAFEQSVTLLEGRLKLKVNRAKSSIQVAATAMLLGFAFFRRDSQVKVKVAPAALVRARNRLRELTSRRWSVSMAYRLMRINDYIRGWMGYFRLSEAASVFRSLDRWLRRRLRQVLWVQWKNGSTRAENLRKLGIAADEAGKMGHSSRGYWRVARSPIIHRALPNEYWVKRGLLTFEDAWTRFHRPSEPPYARPAR